MLLYCAVLQIEFSSSMETVGEVVGSVMVEVVKAGENERPVGVILSTLNGTAFGVHRVCMCVCSLCVCFLFEPLLTLT